MLQAEKPSSTSRRALLAASIAAPLVGAAAPARAADDQQFLTWERELMRLEAASSDGLSDEEAVAQLDEAGRYADLIIHTRSTTVTAARVKMRWLANWAGETDNWLAPMIRDVLASLR